MPELVVAGRSSFEESGAYALAGELWPASATTVRVEGPLPTVEEGQRLADTIRQAAADRVIAVGGGLVLDTAKLAVFACKTDTSVKDLIGSVPPEPTSDIPLIAIPTTAGSGAEATSFAVVYENGIKYSVDHPGLKPNDVVLRPSLSHSMPTRVAAAAGLDALVHCIESLWACRSTDDSMEAAAGALAQILTHLEPAVVARQPESMDLMFEAAHRAGQAIAVSRTTAAHALSYHLTSRYGISHGHAVALMVVPLLEINSRLADREVNDERGDSHVERAVRSVIEGLGGSDAGEAGRIVLDLVERLGLETSPLGAIDVSDWLGEVNIDRLANNPVRLEESDLSTMMEVVA